MIETAAILAGGLATRLRPITEKIPKSLVEVAGLPFIDWQLRLLQERGLRRIVLCVGYLGEQIEAVVGDGSAWNLEVKYSYDGPRQLGTGGALVQALPLLGSTFWVLYGDSYLDFDYRAVAGYYDEQKSDKPGLMTVFGNHNKWDTSNVIFVDGQLLEYNKWQLRPEMKFIDYGAAILEAAAFEQAGPPPFDLADLYHKLVQQGRMSGYEVTQRFYEIGSPAGLEEAQSFFSGRAEQER